MWRAIRLLLFSILLWGIISTQSIYGSPGSPAKSNESDQELATIYHCEILPVEEVFQEENLWCWAACSQALLDYYGSYVGQCEIADYARISRNWGDDNCCSNPSGPICNQINYIYDGPGTIQDILQNFGGITSSGISNYLNQAEVEYEILNHAPFVIRWGWDSGGGHFIVCRGICDNYIYYMDPLYGFEIADHSWVVDGGNHTWTHTLTTNPIPIWISGYVRNSDGSPIPDVNMAGLPWNPGPPYTDSDGYYSAIVDIQWSGTVTPSKDCYTFDPPMRTYSNVTSDQSGEDYTGIGQLDPPPLITPWNGFACQNTTGTLYWADVIGAAEYVVQMGLSCGIGIEDTVITSYYYYTGLVPDETYYWRVKTKNECGDYGNYSDCYSFTTDTLNVGYIALYIDSTRSSNEVWWPGQIFSFDMYVCCLPSPRGQMAAEFMIEYPGNAIQSTVNYNDDLAHLTMGSLESGFSIGYGYGSVEYCQNDWHWVVRQLIFIISDEASEIRILPHPETDLLFASCLDGFPVEPAYVLNNLFVNKSYSAGALPPPSLEDPSDGFACQNTFGTLDWSSVEGAIGYTIQIGAGCGVGAEYEVVHSHHEFSGLSPGETYYWRVSTKNGCVGDGDYSACYSFTTLPLPAPTLQSPLDGYAHQPISGTLYWADVIGAAEYVVQMGLSCGVGIEDTVITSYYHYTGLVPDETYYWRVKTKNECGDYGNYSDCYSFATDTLNVGYIALYIDSTRSSNEVWSLDQIISFDMYVCCLPSPRGQMGLEFMIEYPGNAIPSTVHMNDNMVHVTFGDLSNGISIGYGSVEYCQNAWHWVTRQEMYIYPVEASEIRILPHPATDLLFASCLDGFPVEPAYVLNNLFINCEDISGDETEYPDVKSFALYQNYPNPFNPITNIRFFLPRAGHVNLGVYRVDGELVATILNLHMPEGSKEVTWDGKDNKGRNVSSGIYFYRLVAGDFVQTKKMVLLR